jgi:hypothetical protein
MGKEFTFFIKDDIQYNPNLDAATPPSGAIVVQNAAGLFREIYRQTKSGDHIVVSFSGGLVEDCLRTATYRLLNPPSQPDYTVDHVTVDMSTSTAFAEQSSPMSAAERRRMFLNLFDDQISQDPRLTVLPEME